MSPQAMPTEPEVSVAIVNFNGVKALEPTIRSVLAQKGVRIAQVMLADNASTDGTVEFVRREFPGVRIEVLPENRGPNPARNKGLQLSTTDLVLVMDNDLVLEPDYARRLADVFRAHPDAGAVTGQIRVKDQPNEVQYNGVDIHYAGEIRLRDFGAKGVAKITTVSAGAAMFHRGKALDVGGFDEDFFFGWEDGDLAFRLTLSGSPCYVDSAAIGYHIKGQRSLKWVRMQTRNRCWFFAKNLDRRTIVLSLPAMVAFQLCTGIFFLTKGRFGDYVGGLRDAWATRRQVLTKRDAIQRIKQVSDAHLLVGDRFSIPGNLAASLPGRFVNGILNISFHIYWLFSRGFLKER